MSSSDTKRLLDKIAENYHLSPEIRDKEYDERFHQYSFDWIRKEVDSTPRVLELGFGEGNFTEFLLADGKEVEIIEGAGILVDEARKRFGDRVKVHHSLFQDFRPEKGFDCVLATNILEHVDDPVGVLRTMHGWLNPQGKALVTVPNAESFHRRLAVLMGLQPSLDTLSARDHVVGHQRVYQMDTLTADVHASGFQVESATGFVLKMLPNSMMKDFSDSLLDALHSISPQVDPRYLANIGLVIKRR